MITKAAPEDRSSIIKIWELSVKATHDFLPEDYFLHIKKLLPDILLSVDVYVKRDEDDAIVGFLGVVNDKVEMLFIHPDEFGRGFGKILMQFAIQQLHVTKVDVNEQNSQAVVFYKKLGFIVKSRSDTDGLGKPFPLFHMEVDQ